MPTLVKFVADYADEFTCEQCTIYPEDVNAVLDALEPWLARAHPHGLGFGTNEAFPTGSLKLKSHFTLRAISAAEAECLRELLGTQFGLGVLEPTLGDYAPEED